MEYSPYKGPAGPTASQQNQNTLHLKEKLDELNIKSKTDLLYNRLKDSIDPCDTLELVVTNSKGEELYAGYDRWGFVVEGVEDSFDLDQISLNKTVEYIKNWY